MVSEEKFSYWDLFVLMYKYVPNKKIYILAITFIAISHIASLGISLIIGKIVDFFIQYNNEGLTQFYVLLAFLGGTFLFSAGLRVLGKYWVQTQGVEVQKNIKVQGYKRLLNLSLTWHEKELTGNKLARINGGARTIRDLYAQLANRHLSIIISAVGVITIFIFLDILYFLFFLAYTTIFFTIEYVFSKKIARITAEIQKSGEKASGTFYEASSNVLSIKATGAKKRMIDHVDAVEEQNKKRKLKSRNLKTLKRGLFQIVHAVALVTFFFLIARSLLAGLLTAGFILVYYDYFARLRNSINESAEWSTVVIEQREVIRRMKPIFETKVDSWFGKKLFPKTWSALVFDNIDFTYDEGKKKFSIKQLCLNIQKNEKIGVVGASGSGKSTIAKVLMGLYPIKKGHIHIGRENFYDINHDAITDNIAIVLQESELFNMSFKDNITLLAKFNKKRFDLAMDIAELKPILKKLPRGIDTKLGEKGYKLSGGERQRIGIARAVYKDPQILILDEATSALDTHTERKIQHKLEKKLKKKTIISIAHRLSTLTGVDRIIVFKNGKIVEEGTYKKLSTSKSIFRSMLKQQKQ